MEGMLREPVTGAQVSYWVLLSQSHTPPGRVGHVTERPTLLITDGRWVFPQVWPSQRHAPRRGASVWHAGVGFRQPQ